ncbi:MAG: pseudouridine synthase [Acidobacteriota bacterium]
MGESAWSILYRDEHLVAVDKPAGIPVHHGASRDGVPMLQRVRDRVGARVHPVHRLDRPTSGVLVFAFDAPTTAALQAQLVSSAVKRYVALVRGVPPAEVRVDRPVPGKRDGTKVPAETRFRRLGVSEERWGLVEARPRSGRRHQIRRHLKSLSLPIVGDVNYGKGPINRLFRERFGLHRLALHAATLRLEHPHSGDELLFSAPIRGALARTLEALGFAEALVGIFGDGIFGDDVFRNGVFRDGGLEDGAL